METAAYHHHDHRRQVVDHDHQQHKPKWEGKASTLLKTCKPQQVWPLSEDFFGLNKWFPTLSICLPVEGTSGQPVCIRYCAWFKTPVDDHKYNKVSSEKERVNWTKQKLLSIDPDRMDFNHSIVDGNVGFNSHL